mgnify:CR=1 FL=1
MNAAFHCDEEHVVIHTDGIIILCESLSSSWHLSEANATALTANASGVVLSRKGQTVLISPAF